MRKLLNSVDIPFKGRLELGPGVSVTMEPIGNWRRIYRDEISERGYCPHFGREFGVLSNGNIVFCHLDYDGKTAFANAKDGELRYVLQTPELQKEIDKSPTKRIVPRGCQCCIVPYKYSKQTP